MEDADMEKVPADAAAAAGAVAGDAMAEAVDPAEPLDGEVDELARPVALVADRLGLGVVGGEAAAAAPAQDHAHGRDRAAEPAGDGRAGQPLAAQRHDLGLGRLAQPGRAAMRPGRAVGQARSALPGMPVAPLAHGPGVDSGCGRHRCDRPAVSQAPDHQPSTVRGGSGILVDVHPAAPGAGCELGSHNLPAPPRMGNLRSNDS